MTARTRLVMFGQVVLFGRITPVRPIAYRVHARGAKLLVDGVLGTWSRDHGREGNATAPRLWCGVIADPRRG
jgi:hypothetical protein